jgi:hypothetical protein
MRRSLISSPLPERERIEGEGPYAARDFFACDLRFWLCLNVSAEKLVDCLKNLVHICKHLIVPKSKHSVVPGFQKRSPIFIFLRKIGVLGTIQFNNETPFDRAEVRKVRTNRMLTPEFGVPHSAAAQVSPQQSFSVGLFAAQPARVPLR